MPSDAAMRAAKAIFDLGLLEDHPIGYPMLAEAALIIDQEIRRVPHDIRFDQPPNQPEHMRRNGGGYA